MQGSQNWRASKSSEVNCLVRGNKTRFCFVVAVLVLRCFYLLFFFPWASYKDLN